MNALSTAYSKKSEKTLKAAQLLYEHDFLEESIALTYYAMYHKATALLRQANIISKSHTTTIHTLSLFGVNSTPIKHAKRERIDKQYYVDAKVVRKEARELLEQARTFIGEIDLMMDSLTQEQLASIHNTHINEESIRSQSK